MEYFIVKERCATIRTLARDALVGNWITGFFVFLIFNVIQIWPGLFLLYTFGEGAFLVIFLYSILVAGPLLLGLMYFSLNLARDQYAQVGQIFFGFERLFKAVGASVMLTIFIMLWGLSGVVVMGILMATMFGFGAAGFFGFFVLILLIIIAYIPAIIAALRYSQTYFILADNSDVGVFESISISKKIMYGNKLKLLLLFLSFFGWALLASVPHLILRFAIGPAAVGSSALSDLLIIIIPSIPFYFVELYLFVSFAVFHDMITGRLRPGTIEATAEIIEPQNMPPNMHPNEPRNVSPNETDAKVNHEMSTPHEKWTSEGYVPVNESPNMSQSETNSNVTPEMSTEEVIEDSRIRKLRERYQTKNDNQD